ncbi:S1C family serine protease [Herbaspirillum rhizosphaerae]|uniref:S1C family serine protease n=1 Tax=Herbaspirillum rhizosphaerae TaxID=346179 RepID=UPI0009FAC116|nr:PDZ domain-containing protein [Herbaspirillum rhizosphaerae]
MTTYSKLLAWAAAACAAIALSGCMAVHSVVSPMMQSAMQNSVEANATPESMGISTSAYRGKSCTELAALAQQFAKSQNDPGTEPFTRKTFGWHIDAINQVRSEQGCIAGGGTPKVGASGEVPMFGFCWYAEPGGTGTFYASPVFPYVDWYVDRGDHETKEFVAYLKSRYSPAAAAGYCQAEDTRARADAAREKLWGQMFGNLSSRRVAVAWTPVSKPPPRKPVTKTAVATQPSMQPAMPLAPSSGANANPGTGAAKTMGLQLVSVDEASAKKLGLKSVQGALVSDVAKNGTAAKAGLRQFDVIAEIAGQETRTPEEAQAILEAMRPGFNAPLRVWRARKMLDLTLEVAPAQ